MNDDATKNVQAYHSCLQYMRINLLQHQKMFLVYCSFFLVQHKINRNTEIKNNKIKLIKINKINKNTE